MFLIATESTLRKGFAGDTISDLAAVRGGKRNLEFNDGRRNRPEDMPPSGCHIMARRQIINGKENVRNFIEENEVIKLGSSLNLPRKLLEGDSG